MKHLAACEEPFQDGQLYYVYGLRAEVEGTRACCRVVARSPDMRALLGKVSPVALNDAPVVIRGESGTRKEVSAQSLHANRLEQQPSAGMWATRISPRGAGPSRRAMSANPRQKARPGAACARCRCRKSGR